MIHEATMRQLAQADFFGFSKEIVEKQISAVGPDDAHSIAQWLLQSGAKMHPEVAAKCLVKYDGS